MAFRLKCRCGSVSVCRVKSYHIHERDSVSGLAYCFIVCDACDQGSLLYFPMNTGWEYKYRDFADDSTIINVNNLESAQLVPRAEVRSPPYLPSLLSEYFDDAEFNYHEKRWKPAANLYLQCLEFACVELAAPENGDAETESANRINLTERINSLYKSGKLTEDLKNWGHQIRVIGQYHKHRYVPTDYTDASDLRDFVEMFLKYTFSVPGQIDARRERMKAQAE